MSNPKDITMWDTFLQTFGCSFAPLLVVAVVAARLLGEEGS
jgi:hypothetical protein